MRTGPLGRAGGPVVHVPKELLLGAWAVVAVLGVAYMLVAVSAFEPGARAAPGPVAEAPAAEAGAPAATTENVAEAPASVSGVTTAKLMTTRAETNAAEVDTDAFI